MSLEIKIKTEDIEALEFWAKEIEARLNSASREQKEKLKEGLQKIMSEDVQKRFASSPPTVSGGVVHGEAYWKPLSESYLAMRPDRAQGKIYIDSGELMRSFSVGSPQLISEFDNELGYQFGTKIPYAQELQNMRQIVFFYDALLESLAEEFLDWALELPEDSKLK